MLRTIKLKYLQLQFFKLRLNVRQIENFSSETKVYTFMEFQMNIHLPQNYVDQIHVAP